MKKYYSSIYLVKSHINLIDTFWLFAVNITINLQIKFGQIKFNNIEFREASISNNNWIIRNVISTLSIKQNLPRNVLVLVVFAKNVNNTNLLIFYSCALYSYCYSWRREFFFQKHGKFNRCNIYFLTTNTKRVAYLMIYVCLSIKVVDV